MTMTMSVARITCFVFCIILNINIFSFNAYSCPDFSIADGSGIGRFQCTNPNGAKAHKIQIEKITREGNEVYLWSNDSVLVYEFITDGIERNMPGYDPSVIYSARCERDLLVVDQRGNLYEKDKQIGSMSYRAIFYQDTAMNLHQAVQGISKYKGVITPFQFNITCNRI